MDFYSVIVIFSNGLTKEFTEFTRKEAKEFAYKIARKGCLMSEPNGKGWWLYPPHRIQLIQINKVVALEITQPDYFEDDQECGYCHRKIGTPHKSNCRQ